MQYSWIFRDFKVLITVRPNQRPDSWARMSFGQITPTQMERHRPEKRTFSQSVSPFSCQCSTWEQSVWENKQAGNNTAVTGESEIHWGEVACRRMSRAKVDGMKEERRRETMQGSRNEGSQRTSQ
ncbi:unnamed protein product [Gordionus sp. m RMFG-2023]